MFYFLSETDFMVSKEDVLGNSGDVLDKLE